MKAKRLEVKISLCICIVCFLFLLAKWFGWPQLTLFQNTDIYTFMLSVFCSAIVVFLISLGSYQVIKRQNIFNTIFQGYDYASQLIEFSRLLTNLYKKKQYESYVDLKYDIVNEMSILQKIDILTEMYNNWFYGDYWYYPILRKNKNNLKIHHLQNLMSMFNNSIMIIKWSNERIMLEIDDVNDESNALNFLNAVKSIIDKEIYLNDFSDTCKQIEAKYHASDFEIYDEKKCK